MSLYPVSFNQTVFPTPSYWDIQVYSFQNTIILTRQSEQLSPHSWAQKKPTGTRRCFVFWVQDNINKKSENLVLKYTQRNKS